jgi:hypothetical protein
MQYVEGIGQDVILFCIGGLLIAAYLYTGTYGLLVPGGILLGLGLGSIGEHRFRLFEGDFTLLGLGIGFATIWLVALLYRRRSHWWPLIPGTILIIAGLRAGRETLEFLLEKGWPLILVFVGLLIVIGALGRGSSSEDDG